MKRILIFSLLAALVATGAAWAGHGQEKCTSGTQDCLNMMAKNLQKKGLVGVEGEWDDAVNGYRIEQFVDGSHAQQAGIRAGDVMVAVNGIALNDKDASYADRENRLPGKTAKVTLLRDDEKVHVKIELVGMSEEQIARVVGDHMLQHAEGEAVAQAD